MTDGQDNSADPGAERAHCGFAALVGRPNVGKSTLLNALLGQKVSIVSPKPQTTRTRIHGVLTRPGMQVVFVDLPGLHARQPRAINRYMNRTALASLADSDVNLFVIEALRWTDEDERALAELVRADRPILLVINKVDRARPRPAGRARARPLPSSAGPRSGTGSRPSRRARRAPCGSCSG